MQELTRNTKATIGTSASVIALEQYSPNAQRKFFSAINTSTAGQNITIAIDAEAIAGQGIVLSPGGKVTISQDAGFTPTNKQITAISDGAGGTLAIMDIITVR